jgi:hypothetical protein
VLQGLRDLKVMWVLRVLKGFQVMKVHKDLKVT